MNLYEWQRPLAERLSALVSQHNVVVVALPMGSGKSYIVADVAAKRPGPMVVICPKSALTMWKCVTAGFGKPADVVVNWEKLKTGKTACWNRDTQQWLLPSDTTIILDESHKQCSGMDSQSGKIMAALKAYPYRVIMVSATMAATPLHMRHSGFLLGLHEWNHASWNRWLYEHKCRFDKDNHYWRPPRGKAALEVMSRINAIISDKLIYKKLSEIPGFPPTLIQAKLYDLNKRETDEIKLAYEEMSERLKKPGMSELTIINKARERAEWIKTDLLVELVRNSLDQGNSVVVFMNYTEPRLRLESLLRESGVDNISMIYGAQDHGDSTKNRDAAIAAFQNNDNHVMLAMAQAGGISVNFHDVHKVRPRAVYLSPSYNASDVKQCLGRVPRIDGSPSVQEFVLIAGTQEQKVYKAVMAKLNNIEYLNDGDLVI